VPSVAESAIFGTKLGDTWFGVDTGGDLAFLNGVFKILCAEGWLDEAFIAAHTSGFETAKQHVSALSWEDLEGGSGTTRADMHRFAAMLRDAKTAVFVWSMGLTQHAHGVETIQALINVGLARGYVGREHCGLMPIRGHSGVQGGAEVGCAPALDEKQKQRFEKAWGFALPAFDGMTASEMVDAAYREALEVFWTVGGNFLETLPDPAAVAGALAGIPVRIHQDIVTSSMMLLPPRDVALLLPATTRYESPGGGTETSTERRIIFSPEVRGRRIGSAKPEWEVFGEIAARVRPEHAPLARFSSAAAIRQEIAACVPLYAGIESLRERGQSVQWGGRHLFADGNFATADGKAHFSCVSAQERRAGPAEFYLSTRRGKQFNSMVQKRVDPLTGAARDDVLIAAEDAARLGLADGDRIRLVSAQGVFEGRARLAEIKSKNLEVHWPEGNVLLDRTAIDRASREPDYNALVRLEPVP